MSLVEPRQSSNPRLDLQLTGSSPDLAHADIMQNAKMIPIRPSDAGLLLLQHTIILSFINQAGYSFDTVGCTIGPARCRFGWDRCVQPHVALAHPYVALAGSNVAMAKSNVALAQGNVALTRHGQAL